MQTGNTKQLASSSPEKDNKKAKDALCKTCSKPVSEDVLECIWCEGFQHRECTKVSADVCNALSSVNDNIVFFVLFLFTTTSTVALKCYDTQSNVDSNVALIESFLLGIQKSEKNLCDLVKQFETQLHDHH